MAGPKYNLREDAVHKAVADFLRLALRDDQATFTHPDNGANKSKAQAGLAKARGQQAGEPDIQIVWKEHGIARFGVIELKAPTERDPQTGKIVKRAGRLSAAQIDRLATYHKLDARTAVCFSVIGVEAMLRYWGVPLFATLGELALPEDDIAWRNDLSKSRIAA